MSPEVTERFFRVFWYQDKEVFSKIALVELQDYPNAAVEELSQLRSNKNENLRVQNEFFYDIFEGKTGGEAYEINVMMVKLQLEEGTTGSRQFL
jgi:hypothetical protein